MLGWYSGCVGLGSRCVGVAVDGLGWYSGCVGLGGRCVEMV